MQHPLSAFYLGTDLAGRYRLEHLIGEGASSWVFAGTDLRLDREVAVKLVKPRPEPEHSSARVRLVREGRTLAKLAHPHVVAVHDAGATPEGDRYLVMELSRTGTLEAELCRCATLSLEETLQLVLPLLGALACAHDRGIIHRDLKPANIALVRHDGSKMRAKLLDFGIAQPSLQGLSSGGLIGTPAYMAPEQARAEPLGPSADVWAMGVVLFRCLSGRLPFEANSSTAMLLKLVQERAPRIASACPALPPRIAVALDRSLEPDPADRYPDMRTFARVLGIACRQDGVRVDLNPDPIGLPEFGSWLEGANIETTWRESLTPGISPVHVADSNAGTEPGVAGGAAVLAAKCAPPQRASRRAALWTVAALVALLVAAWSTTAQPAPTRGQRSPAGSATRVRSVLEPELKLEPRAFQPASATLPLSETARIAPTASRQTAPRSKAPARPLPKAHKSTDPADVTRSPSAAGVDRQRTQPDLITNWEW